MGLKFGVGRVALSLAIVGVWLAFPAAARTRHAAAESTSTVKRITIDQDGIQIDRSDSRSSRRAGRHHFLIRDDDPADEDSIGEDSPSVAPRVRISGPGLVVEGDESDLVRVFSDAVVPAGERIDGDVVAVFGSVTVDGQVSGNVVAVFGSVRLRHGAAVDGDAVAIGGGLEQAPGATVSGESVSLGFLPVPWGVPGLFALLVVVLVGWLITLLAGWLVTLIFPNRMLRVALTASRRVVGSFFLGILSGPLLVITIVLLLVTMIGIPIALVLPLFYLLIVWMGQLAAAYVLGARLLRRRPGDGGPMMPIFVGTLFVAAFFVLGAVLAGPEGASRTLALFFSLLGALLVIGLSAVGTGAVLLSRFGSRPRDMSSGGPTPAVAVPGSSAAAGTVPAASATPGAIAGI
jgi:hypothetical protein